MTEPLELHRPQVPTVLQPFLDPQGRLIKMPRREQRRIEASPGRYAWGHPVQPQVKDVT